MNTAGKLLSDSFLIAESLDYSFPTVLGWNNPRPNDALLLLQAR